MTFEMKSFLLAKIGLLAVLTMLIVFAGSNNSRSTSSLPIPVAGR